MSPRHTMLQALEFWIGDDSWAFHSALLGSLSKRFRIAIALMALSPLTAVYAQHASDDPLATANDAFGLTLGLESIGLYGPGGVRGFNPQSAGNVRIDGLYFDQPPGPRGCQIVPPVRRIITLLR